MPQTTDQPTVPAIIRVLAEWEDANGSLSGILPEEWMALLPAVSDAAAIQSPRMARAVPLVAEAPMEPVAGLTISETPAGPAFEVSLGQGIFSLNLPPGVYPLYAAPPVSVAPMPEEWLKEAMRLANWYARAKSCALQLCMPPTAEDSFLTNARAAVEDAEAALLSHLRTAPLTLSDEQIKAAAVAWHDNDTLGDETCEHRFLEIIAFAAGVRWVASVAPQPEQPNTDSVHLAANRESAVRGLDAADGVGVVDDTTDHAAMTSTTAKE